MPRPRRLFNSLQNSWRLFAAIMFILSLALGVLDALNLDTVLGPFNRMFYDRFTTISVPPARQDVVLIAIDDDSLDQLGRAAWPRAVHARLLDQLTLGRPKAIGITLDFTEPDAEGDLLLATALARNGRVVLPVFIEQSAAGAAASGPAPMLAHAANRLGHTHLDFDRDGLVRGVFLCEGKNWPLLQQFALAMLELGHDIEPDQGAAGTSCAMQASDTPTGLTWLHRHRVGIPFIAPLGRLQRAAYADVLDGTVPASFFKDKYVIIGTTAAGLGNGFPTPMAAKNGLMPGSEVQAAILAALLEHRAIYRSSWWEAGLLAALPVIVALLGGLYLSPRLALAGTLALAPAYLALSYWAWTHQYWLPPAAGLLLLSLSYPLWSWLRLEATLSYMGSELQRFNQENLFSLIPHIKWQGTPYRDGDYVGQRIGDMQDAAARVRDLQGFSHDILESLPDATLVIDDVGRLVTFNRKAVAMFDALQCKLVHGLRLSLLFDGFSKPLDSLGNAQEWDQLAGAIDAAAQAPVQLETRDRSLCEYQLNLAVVRHSGGGVRGHILVLRDISALRQAERYREETLQFTSHDMRGPQSSILALLALQRQPAHALPVPELMLRIEKSVQQTLALAEEFVQMSKAQAPAYQLHEFDFSALVSEAVDEMWSLAKARQMVLTLSTPNKMIWVRADHSLLWRAILNLLSNAIKFSPSGSAVEIAVQCLPSAPWEVLCSITDHGVGIAADQQAHLFQRFRRGGDQHTAGVGLGLAFVKVVVERLQGSISVSSVKGQGSCFVIKLPCMTEDASLDS